MSDLLEKLGWLSAENLALYHTLCLFHKVHRFREPEGLAADITTVAEGRAARGLTDRSTRQDRDLHVPRSRTEMGKRRFSCRGPLLYNDLPPELSELPVPPFCRRLKRYLLDRHAAPPD